MSSEKIETNNAPMAVGPYSQGIAAGNLVFTAGEIPVDPATGEIPDTLEGQVRLAMSNLIAVLEAGRVKKNNVVSVTLFLKNIDDFSEVNRIYAEFFEEPFPARSCVAVAAIPKGVSLMVSAIGVKE